MCGRVAYAPLMDLDNGEAGPEGQPPLAAFPKGFIEGFVEVFVGLTGDYESGQESAFQQQFDPFVEFFEAGAV